MTRSHEDDVRDDVRRAMQSSRAEGIGEYDGELSRLIWAEMQHPAANPVLHDQLGAHEYSKLRAIVRHIEGGTASEHAIDARMCDIDFLERIFQGRPAASEIEQDAQDAYNEVQRKAA